MDPKVAMVQLRSYLDVVLHPPYDAAKIMVAIAGGIRLLAGVKAMSGMEKKAMLLSTIKEVLGRADIPESMRSALIDLVDGIGDSVIDGMVSFGQDMKTFAKGWRCCGA